MSPGQIAAENLALLSHTWEWLRAGRTLGQLGIDIHVSRMLHQMNRHEVSRAADCHVPLFSFACTPDILEKALSSEGGYGVDQRAEIFLANRWRIASRCDSGLNSLLGVGKRMADVLNVACFPSVQRAARAGIQVIRFNLRPQYLHHAGKNLAMQTAHRSQLAVLNSGHQD